MGSREASGSQETLRSRKGLDYRTMGRSNDVQPSPPSEHIRPKPTHQEYQGRNHAAHNNNTELRKFRFWDTSSLAVPHQQFNPDPHFHIHGLTAPVWISPPFIHRGGQGRPDRLTVIERPRKVD
ncbi:hypothetical protein FQN53_005168 [Emmonsiellopsis sp. PD_33]|nr:hypothetical protein FQN53_005168 [Emmonsiellopsis sp. PD_33]